jgi:aryl-alcohol dehydrogenase-like predicted oxidoreductase
MEEMKTRSVGALEISLVGLGTNNFGTDFFRKPCDREAATRILAAALDAGVNFIDSAEEYSVKSANGTGESEQIIGQALKKLGVRRHEVIIATKFLNVDLEHPDERGRKRIRRALEGSLRRLDTNYVDLYQQHRPDPATPIDETLAALEQLVREGQVREIGCSNYPGALLDKARAAGENQGLPRFVTTQSRYNVLQEPREEGVLDACERNSVALLPYYPLANGLLTGKYSRDQVPPPEYRLGGHTRISDRYRSSLLTPECLAKVCQLESFARERKHTLLELAVSWLAPQPLI